MKKAFCLPGGVYPVLNTNIEGINPSRADKEDRDGNSDDFMDDLFVVMNGRGRQLSGEFHFDVFVLLGKIYLKI